MLRSLALRLRSQAGTVTLHSLVHVGNVAGSGLTPCHSYTDLQPVGMGAFGLVWYGTSPAVPDGACGANVTPM